MSSQGWRRIQILLLVSGGVPAVVALVLIWVAPDLVRRSPATRWTLTTIVVATWLLVLLAARERIVERMRTFSNILNAVREADYTVRATGARAEDPFGEIATELNALGATLRGRRLERKEADALLGKVLEEIDVGIFAFDDGGVLRLVNRQGARWLARPESSLVGTTAQSLGLAGSLSGDSPRVADMALPGGTARYEIRRVDFRQEGRAHRLLVVHDLSRALAAEERMAWRRLLQVLRHEINNSLAPIRSIAGTLRAKLARTPRPEGLGADLAEGLEVIESRTDSLARLMAAYARLSRLPPPTPVHLDVRACVERVVALEDRVQISVAGGPELTIRADPDQLEQALINLVRNAADAALQGLGGVRVGWERLSAEQVRLWIEDDGPGLGSTENLFVPFFSTKPGGSGIGLVLSRHVVESHDGRLRLANRDDGPGCRVTITLPVDGPPPPVAAHGG